MIFPTKFTQASSYLITSKTFTEITEYGMVSEVAKRGNPHKWLVDFSTRKLTHTNARELQSFMDSLDGRYNTFTLPCLLPFLGSTNSFLVAANANAGVNTVSVKSLPVSGINALVAGDYVKFSNHDKVYKITSTVDSSAAGTAIMSIHPRLQANILLNNAVSEGVFTLRLTKDTSGLNITKDVHYLIKISAIEA